MKKILVAALLLISLVGLTGCKIGDDGEPFDVTGSVTRVGENSVSIDTLSVEQDGNRFSPGSHHRVHDNCDCHGTWNGRKTYGQVFDSHGDLAELSDIRLGDCVHLAGKIRRDSDGKYSHDRPVFYEATIIECSEVQ